MPLHSSSCKVFWCTLLYANTQFALWTDRRLISNKHVSWWSFSFITLTPTIVTEKDSPGSCNKYLYGSSRIRSEAAPGSQSIAFNVRISTLEEKDKWRPLLKDEVSQMMSPESLNGVDLYLKRSTCEWSPKMDIYTRSEKGLTKN